MPLFEKLKGEFTKRFLTPDVLKTVFLVIEKPYTEESIFAVLTVYPAQKAKFLRQQKYLPYSSVHQNLNINTSPDIGRARYVIKKSHLVTMDNSDSCQKCPDDQWPNEKKDACVPKPIEFVSLNHHPVVLFFCIVSIFSSIVTFFILIIFISFHDTPIVKANNQNLSFVLLVSIMLSFLCVFLFIGRPVDIICMLRQTSLGILFSVAVSSLLAKTIMVCLAFKATKPGSSWKKWVGITTTNCIVFICSLVQVFIITSWLAISPPFQELNTHSHPGKVIIQCNEGSLVGFYSVLGYMGFLATMSFIVAFLARKLPDGFNEAKYITFSMLVFCNVWITFIPAYMSVTGANTVLVEMFAILASSAGILVCIFFPKCYVILLRPDMNTKRNLQRL
ncbi:vomeronasal type-2 receptor 26-like [Pelodytes ibericus]